MLFGELSVGKMSLGNCPSVKRASVKSPSGKCRSGNCSDTKSIISQFIEATCKVIYNTLAPHYLKIPIVRGYEIIQSNVLNWDGSLQTVWCSRREAYIGIIYLKNSRSKYCNYKGFHSLFNYWPWLMVFVCWSRNDRQTVYVNM